jgi:hypothetical protein
MEQVIEIPLVWFCVKQHSIEDDPYTVQHVQNKTHESLYCKVCHLKYEVYHLDMVGGPKLLSKAIMEQWHAVLKKIFEVFGFMPEKWICPKHNKTLSILTNECQEKCSLDSVGDVIIVTDVGRHRVKRCTRPVGNYIRKSLINLGMQRFKLVTLDDFCTTSKDEAEPPQQYYLYKIS